MLKYANLALLILFPITWFAPLMRAGLLPLFGLSEISVMTGLQSLWQSDVILALVVTIFALFAPYLKTIGLALIHFNLLDTRALPGLTIMGKLAMADIFLIALYITLAKGNRSKQVTEACKEHGGFYLGSIGGPAAILAVDCIKHVEVVEYEDLGMEAIWKIEVENFPAFIIVDDKGNDFFQDI